MSFYSDKVNSLLPVAYWRLGESIGDTIAVDEVGNSDGTFVNNPILEHDGLVVNDANTSMLVNNTVQYVNAPTSNLVAGDDFSVSVIIQGAGYAFNSHHPSLVKFALNPTFFGYYNGSWHQANNPITLDPNRTYHLVGVQRGTSVEFYIDGVMVASIISDNTVADTNPYYIGKRWDNAVPAYFEGSLSDACVFDYALLQDDITDLYNTYKGITLEPQTYNELIYNHMPLSYFRLGESTGETIAINEMTYYNGTYINSPILDDNGLVFKDLNSAVTFTKSELEAILFTRNSELDDLFLGGGSISFLCEPSIGIIGDGVDSARIVDYDSPTSANYGWSITIGSNGSLGFYIRSLGEYSAWDFDNLIEGKTSHIVLTFDSTSISNDPIVYINNNISSVALDVRSTVAYGSDVDNILHIANGSQDRFYDGTIDEVSLFNSILTHDDAIELNDKAQAYAFDITIDHNKVDEDLYNFPLLVNLGSSSGTNAFDSTSAFRDISNTIEYDFNYPNNTPFDPTLWQDISSAGATYDPIGILDNKMRLYVTASNANYLYVRLQDLNSYTGDVNFEVDWDVIGSLSTNKVIILLVLIGTRTIMLRNNGGGQYDGHDSYGWVGTTAKSTAIVNGRFRIERIGDTVTTYIKDDDNPNWLQIWTKTSVDYVGGFQLSLGLYMGATYAVNYGCFYNNLSITADNAYDVDDIKKFTATYINPADGLEDIPQTVEDDFTGIDNDPPNTELWNTSLVGTGQLPIIDTNRLKVEVLSSSVGNSITSSTFTVDGDFDIQVDFDYSGSGSRYSQNLHLYNSISAYIGRYNYSSDGYYRSGINGVINLDSSRIDATGLFRITRVDDILTTYYYNVGWIQVGSATFNTDPVTVRLDCAIWNTTSTALCYFDNFIVNQGMILGLPPIYPADDTVLSRKCYIEIDRWDQLAEESQLWINVPYVSKDIDTTINLSYNSLNSDNSTYIGVTGEVPAQTVWADFNAVYHLSKDGVDSTSNSFDGTLVNMDSSNIVDADIGKALEFNGVDDHILLPNLSHGDLGELSISITAVANTTNNMQAFSLNLSAPFSLLRLNNDNVVNDIRTYISHTTTVQDFVSNITDTTLENTYNITSKEATSLDIYYNGVTENSTEIGSGVYNFITPELNVIGDSRALDHPFNGRLKEFRISKNIDSVNFISTNYESIQDNLTSYVLVDTYSGLLPVALGELIGYSGSYNEWTKNQALNFIINDPKVMFAVRSRYKETLSDRIQTRLFVRPSLPNDYNASISGITYVRSIPTRCIVYVYTKDMNLVDVFLSNEDGTYETSSVDISNDYHVVAKSLTNECPQISGMITPI